MDFVLPPSLPAGGIPWEKVLPPLIPRLNGTYGHNWSPTLVLPETENNSSVEFSEVWVLICAGSAGHSMIVNIILTSIDDQVNCDSSGFTVQVDVRLFNPEDLVVKVVGDFVEVQGKHEERKKEGSGFTTRQFNRRYRIPKGVDALALESAVSPDGILFISAPMLPMDNSRSLI